MIKAGRDIARGIAVAAGAALTLTACAGGDGPAQGQQPGTTTQEATMRVATTQVATSTPSDTVAVSATTGGGGDTNTDTGSSGRPLPTPTDNPGKTQCGDVAFEPESDAGAFNIVAVNVGCDTARSVAAFGEGMIGEPYGTPSGFSCLPERDDSGPTPEVFYTCTRADAKITFDT